MDYRKNIIREIRDGYAEYKGKLMSRSEELLKNKQMGTEYTKYWKLIESILKNDIFIFHSISLLVIKRPYLVEYMHNWHADNARAKFTDC